MHLDQRQSTRATSNVLLQGRVSLTPASSDHGTRYREGKTNPAVTEQGDVPAASKVEIAPVDQSREVTGPTILINNQPS